MSETYGHQSRRLRRTHAVTEAIDAMKRDVVDTITGSAEPEDIEAMHEDIRGLLNDHASDVLTLLEKADDDQP